MSEAEANWETLQTEMEEDTPLIPPGDWLEQREGEMAPSYWGEKVSVGNAECVYATSCDLSYLTITRCVLENCTLQNCTVENSIVTGNTVALADGCLFKDSIVSGTTSGAIILRDTKLENCFTHRAYHRSRSLSRNIPTNPAAAQFATFEDLRNVLLKECVVDCLRRWIWRLKRKQSGEQYLGVGHLFKTISAGKRPFHVSEKYPVEEQLELPLRRMRKWSLGPPKMVEIDSDSDDHDEK